jgi:hypothetical protein
VVELPECVPLILFRLDCDTPAETPVGTAGAGQLYVVAGITGIMFGDKELGVTEKGTPLHTVFVIEDTKGVGLTVTVNVNVLEH